MTDEKIDRVRNKKQTSNEKKPRKTLAAGLKTFLERERGDAVKTLFGIASHAITSDAVQRLMMRTLMCATLGRNTFATTMLVKPLLPFISNTVDNSCKRGDHCNIYAM